MSESAGTEDASEEWGTLSVLYVEDNQQTGPLVREWLERHDDRFEVALAVTLDAAAERLATESFDAVVADYRFPNGKGLDLVPLARDANPEIPFLLYSARVTGDVEQEADDAGVTAVVEKGGSDQLSKLATHIITGAEQHAAATPPQEPGDDDDRLDAFADDLVHDLRGPLSVAFGHLDMLEADGERAAKLQEALVELETVVDEIPERVATFETEEQD